MSLESEIARLRAALQKAELWLRGDHWRLERADPEQQEAWSRLMHEIAAALSPEPGAAQKPTDSELAEAARRADLDIRTVLMWEGVDWGSPESLLWAVQGIIEELRHRDADLLRAREELAQERLLADKLANGLRAAEHGNDGTCPECDANEPLHTDKCFNEAILAEHAKRRGGR